MVLALNSMADLHRQASIPGTGAAESASARNTVKLGRVNAPGTNLISSRPQVLPDGQQCGAQPSFRCLRETLRYNAPRHLPQGKCFLADRDSVPAPPELEHPLFTDSTPQTVFRLAQRRDLVGLEAWTALPKARSGPASDQDWPKPIRCRRSGFNGHSISRIARTLTSPVPVAGVFRCGAGPAGQFALHGSWPAPLSTFGMRLDLIEVRPGSFVCW